MSLFTEAESPISVLTDYHDPLWWSDAAAAYDEIMPKEHRKPETAMIGGLLFGLAMSLHAKVIVEIGVQFGISTRMLAFAAKLNNGKLISCDIDPACGQGELRRNLIRHGLSTHWEFWGQPSQKMPVVLGTDLLYIDGDHGYPAVCSDMVRHGKAVRDGGIVVLDDYTFAGKRRWVDERTQILDPLIIGPHVIVRVTPDKREAFGPIA